VVALSEWLAILFEVASTKVKVNREKDIFPSANSRQSKQAAKNNMRSVKLETH